MIILRIFLYSICIFSIGWSILVIAGPPIIKRLILEYSDGALSPAGITVTPQLDVKINRLDFIFRNSITGSSIEGFSRSGEISWSFFSEKPLIEINLGPSLVRSYGRADSVDIYTPSFQEIDWQNINLVSSMKGLTLNSFSEAQNLTMEGNLNLESEKITGVKIEAQNFIGTVGGSTYSANMIKGEMNDISLRVLPPEQFIQSTFGVEDLTVSKPNLTVPKATIEMTLMEGAKNIKVNLDDVRVSDLHGIIGAVKVSGSFDHKNVLQKLQVDFLEGNFPSNLPKFQGISAVFNKMNNEQHHIRVRGYLEEFELFNQESYLGLLPSSDFLLNLELDTESSSIFSKLQINFITAGAVDLNGSAEMQFTSERLMDLRCAVEKCELSNFDLGYQINLDDEWVSGSAVCSKSFCLLSDFQHLIKTSNTLNIFTILNQEKILNPISSLYLYGVMTSGQKMKQGHELKFQF